MTHGLTYGYDAFVNPQRLWEHWDYVKQREDSVWVGTFKEIAAYTKERDNIRLTVKQHGSDINIHPETSLDKNFFDEPLTMVVYHDSANGISARQDGKSLKTSHLSGKYIFDFNPHGGTILLRLK